MYTKKQEALFYNRSEKHHGLTQNTGIVILETEFQTEVGWHEDISGNQ